MRDAPERRTIVVPVSFRTETRNGSPVVKGHAAVFNELSEDLGFRETLAPGCFRGALQRKIDQPLVFQHDMSAILARRSAGTLKLTEDSRGLAFEAELVNTSLGRDVAELCRTGHVTECSFAFTVAPGGDDWKRFEGEDHRLVREVSNLYEVSLVCGAAYPAAYVESNARELVAELRARPKAGKAPRLRRDKEADPYASGEHSFFQDLAVEQMHHRRVERTIPGPTGLADPGSRRVPGLNEPELDAASARLKQVRALSSVGDTFVPAGLPPSLTDAFTTAARAVGVLPDVFGVAGEIPKGAGLADKIPGFDTGVTVSVQAADGEAVSQTDPTTSTYSTSGPAMISGSAIASQQLVDLAADPGFDVELAAELGSALAERRDQQILNGTGTNKQTLGLLNVAGIKSATYTDATPTSQRYLRQGVGKLWAEVAKALGRIPDTILMSPGRYSWAFTGYSENKVPVDPDLLLAFAEPDQVPAMPTTLGVSTEEDATVVLSNAAVRYYQNAPVIIADENSLSGNLQVRFVIRQLVALVVRKPVGVGVLLGSGVKTPAFT